MVSQQPKRQQRQHRPQQNMVRPRILRIGIVLGGNIIEERLVRQRETITIGQSSKNHFSIPVEELPKTWPVFTLDNGRYFLHCTDGMDGRISAGGGVHTIAQLKDQGAKRQGNAWVVPLDDHARGKISVGAMTMLFQFVTAPPLQPRPRLPASVRGTLADRIEPRLAIVMATSVLLHFGVALYAYTRDTVIERPVDVIARNFQVGQYEPPPEPEPVEEIPVEDGDGDVVATDTKGDEDNKPKPKSDPTPKSGDGDGDGDKDSAPSDAAVAEEIQNIALVAVLTGGGEGKGDRYGKMSDTDQGASLDDSIAHAKGKATASTGGGNGERRQRGTNSGKIGTGKGERVGGPVSGTGTGPKKEEKVSRVKLAAVEDLSLSDLDPGAVSKRIRGKYLLGIKRCHSRVLKIDPQAQGRVTISFTVGPTGRVTKARVKGFDPTVDACIKGQAAKWRFSAPKDDGKPTSADFEVPLLLKPGA